MRSTIAENNELRMLHADGDRGWVTIDEERDYRFRYELEDLHGNVAVYRFVVRGKRMPLDAPLRNYWYYMEADRDNRFAANGMELWLPQGALFDDIDLTYEVMPSDVDQAEHYRLAETRVPLRKSAELTLPVLPAIGVDASKLYVARVDGKQRVYCGGRYEYGRIRANIKELTTYTVCVDTLAPKVTPIGQTTWKKRGVVTFRITDGETGIRSYRGRIDGRWVLFQYSSKNARLWCDLKAEGIARGKHTIEVEVEDMRRNVKTLVLDCEL